MCCPYLLAVADTNVCLDLLCRSASASETILAALEAASPQSKRPARIHKTALRVLRVDQLRGLLEQLGADGRGTKDVLVQRVLSLNAGDDQRGDDQQSTTLALAGAGVKEG
jgi:hypothetical protein